VPQGSTLGSLVFSLFDNYLCVKIHLSDLLLFVDNLEIFRVVKPPEDCKLLLPNIVKVQNWCTETYMEISIRNTRTTIIFFMPKKLTVSINRMILVRHTICNENKVYAAHRQAIQTCDEHVLYRHEAVSLITVTNSHM
jgi:hypothetical protein